MKFHPARFLTLAVLAGLLACGSGSSPAGPVEPGPPAPRDVPPANEPPGIEVAGAYGLKQFATTRDGVTTDQLAAGVELRLTLAPDGTTTGELLVPEPAGGTGVPVDLAGTWDLTGTTVRFDQAADTFVRQLAFVAEERRLRAEGTLGGTAFLVVLTR